jgi:hypothetical protein
MTDPDIQNSCHLLKRLDEEMTFLSGLMAQVDSLSSQVLFVSSGLKGTWSALDKIHKTRENKEKEETNS